MSKKKKKLKKITKELEWLIDRNVQWCNYNGCELTEYMEGVNDTSKRMIKFIKKLNKK
jgi:hypothetical protein